VATSEAIRYTACRFQPRRRWIPFLLWAFVSLLASSHSYSAESARAKKVLIISTGSRLAPGFIIVDQQLLQILRKIQSPRIETYAENLDLIPFPNERYRQIFRDYLSAKYRENRPDLVILVYVGNLGTAGNLLPELFPDTPIIVAGFTEEELHPELFGKRVSGLAQRVDPQATLELIARLQPEVNRVVVVNGTAEVDRLVMKKIQDAAQRFKNRVKIEFWNDRTIGELREAVKVLPAHTAVLFGQMFRDSAGHALISSEVARSLAQAANAPMYIMTETTLGAGAVGGSLASVETFGKRAGELARLVLSGTDMNLLPFEIRTDTAPIFDWRALNRWGISESRLPPNSIIRFRPQSFWEEYRWYVLGALIVIALQAAIIVDLLVERRRRQRIADVLKESQDLMELATSAGELGLWSRDLTNEDLWANGPMRSLFGFGATESLDFKNLLARVHPNDRERMLLHIEHAEAGKVPFEGEFRIIIPNRAERWVMAKGRTIVDSTDSDARRMGVVLDITERKRAEEKFRIAVEAAPNAIIMVDRQGGILLANPQAEKLFGYSHDELLGQFISILVAERFRNPDPVAWMNFLGVPEARPTGAGQELFGLQKDGTEVPVEFSVTPIDTADAAMALVTIIDLSERKRSAQALAHLIRVGEVERERERAFLRQVIDTDPNFIFAKDRQGRFTLANQAVADAYGTTVDNLIGKTDAELNPNREEVEVFRRDDQEVLETMQDRFIAEERLTDARGRVRWLQTMKRPIIQPDGSAEQVLGSSTDITWRKETELELRERRSELAHVTRISTMGELAASLAHELNQPLTAILSNAQAALRFLSNKPADLEEVREILDDIVLDNSRAGEVIRRMRALVKKEEPEFASLDLVSLTRDVVVLLHSDAILQSVKIALELDDELPPVRGDKVQLQQVMLNLMLNAFDAMKDCTAAEREVRLRVTREDTSLIQAAVSDRGTGLSRDKLDKIFQPFYTTKREGLGMGLSICRSIIEAHGGRLWAENNSDDGATFYFTVPVAEKAAGQKYSIGPKESTASFK
jgi:PAS domain S-box-containing protein